MILPVYTLLRFYRHSSALQKQDQGLIYMRMFIAAMTVLGAAICTATPASAAGSLQLLPVDFEHADPMWQQARSAIDRSVACIAKREANCVTPTIEMLLDELADASLPFQLDVINRWFNRVAYVSDTVNWQSADHWEPINEFLAKGGDCEDYAIAKYAMLRALGLPAKQMRLLIVEDVRKRETHAVLAVDTPAGTRLLDNQLPDVTLLQRVANYRVRVAINENALWRMTDLPLVIASASRR
jgi:predicted transglutaminase-like cysteine proteinase